MRLALRITAAVSLVGFALAGCMRMLNIETEKPLPVITESVNAAGSRVMLAPVQGSSARPAHTELASFAAG